MVFDCSGNGLMNTFLVCITSENGDGRICIDTVEQMDMVGVSRVLLTFKPKRGYEVMRWEIERIDKLI